MLKKSSNFVRVAFADKKKVLRQLRNYAKNIKQTCPEVRKVGLFGSYATDTYAPASDADLLIVLRKSAKRFLDRIPDYFPDKLSVGCDIFPYTERELEKMKKENSPWIRHIFKKVVWL